MNTLREYAELKVQEKAIKARIEELAPVALQEVVATGSDKLETQLGNFTIKRVKRWKYSPAVDEAKLALDTLKGAEEASGTATFVEVEQLEFRTAKKDDDQV